MRSRIQLLVIAFSAAAFGAASVVAFWIWYASRGSYIGRAVPAIGSPRRVEIHCDRFDQIVMTFEHPVLPSSADEPNHITLRFSDRDVEAIRIVEIQIERDLRYWYMPTVMIRLSQPAALRLSEAEAKRPFRGDRAYRLEIQRKLIGHSDLCDDDDDEATRTFESSKFSFDELTSWLLTIPGCTASSGSA